MTDGTAEGPAKGTAEGNRPRMPAVRNTVAVLRRLAASPRPLTAGAIARATLMPRSTTYQLLQVLCDEGLIVHVPESHGYALGIGTFELGAAYLRHEPLEHLARPLLVRLVKRLSETVQLGILHGNETLYLLKEQPEHPTNLVTEVGVRLPAHLTASGRAMLSLMPKQHVLAHFSPAGSFVQRTDFGPTNLRELNAVLAHDRKRGWAVEDSSVSDGITCISAAVRDHTGWPVAAITASFHDTAHPETAWPIIADGVTSTADALTKRLGGTPDRQSIAAEDL